MQHRNHIDFRGGIQILLILLALLPVLGFAASVTVSWQANTEPDLAGYVVYYGTESRNYNYSQRIEGPINQAKIDGLLEEVRYYLTVTAYDKNGNESVFSEEKTFTISDRNRPELVTVSITQSDQVMLVFSEKIDQATANIEQNYQITPGIVVQLAELETDGKTVILTTTGHDEGEYTITINNVRDLAAVPNTITEDTQGSYSYTLSDNIVPSVDSLEVVRDDFLLVYFSEPLQQSPVYNASNFSISPSIAVQGTGLDGTQSIVNLQTSRHIPGQHYTLHIRNMKDAAGNVLTTDVDYEYIADDASAPVVHAVRMISSTEIEIRFNEKLDAGSASDIGNYRLSASVAITGVQLSADQMTVTLTTTEHTAGTHTLTVDAVSDQYGNAASGSVSSYQYTPPDTDRPRIASAAVTYARQLRVQFSETVEELSATTASNYSISSGIAVFSAILAIDGKTVLLDTDAHTKGSFTLTVSQVLDRAETPNVILPGSQTPYTYDPPDVQAPTLLSATLHGPDLLDLEFSEKLDKVSAENVSNFQITPALNIAYADLVTDSENHVYLGTDNHQTGVTYTVNVRNVQDQATVPNTLESETRQYTYRADDTVAPRLTSAVLQGETFLELTFSESLNDVEATNPANYQITPQVTVTEATLDRSLNKVFLYTAGHTVGVSYRVTVQNLRDRAVPANLIGAGSNSASYQLASRDQIPPYVSDVDIRSNTLIEILFNEPVDRASAETEDNYSISGETGIQIFSAELSHSPNVVWLTTSQHIQGSYSVTVSGIEDLAGEKNTMETPLVRQYKYVAPDETPPFLFRVTPVAYNMLELEFTEPLDAATAEDTSRYTITNGIRVTSAFLDESRRIVLLVTSDHISGDYQVSVSGLRDAYGNSASEPQPMTYPFVIADTKKPVITGAEIPHERQVIVAFDEVLDIGTAEETNNYKIDKNITVEDAILNNTLKEVVLTTSPHVADTYTLTVSGVKDAGKNNEIKAYSKVGYIYSPADTTAPALVDAKLLSSSHLSLTFSEAIKEEDANRIANYTIDPPVSIQYASLQSSGNVVWLVTAAHEAGLHTITVNGVHDRAFDPNEISNQNNKQSYVWASADTAAPRLLHVEILTPMVLELVFDEAISSTSAKTLANYKVSPQITVNGAYLLDERNIVHLETSRHSASVPYTVEVKNISDRAPVANTMQAPESMGYSWADADTTSPYIVDYKLQDQRHLEIIFSEKVEELSAENRRNYTIRSGVEVNNAVLDTASMKKVLLETTDHLPFITYEINVKNVKDLAPSANMVAPGRWFKYEMALNAPMASDNNPPQIARVDVLSSTRVDILFTEMVDKETAENIHNYVLEDSVDVISAKLDSNQVRVHLTTTPHDYGQSYSIQVRNIQDRAAKPNKMSSTNAVSYILSESVSVSQVSRGNYSLGMFSQGGSLYADRNYTFAETPDLLDGSIQVFTENSDKADTSDLFLHFEVNGDAQVLLAVDKRVTDLPAWIEDWKSTGDQVISSRATVYNLFSKKIHSDRIVLGGNGGNEEDDMYLVFVKPLGASSSLIAGLNKSAYELSHIEAGETYYIDRNYKISEIPDTLESLLWIKTANDDKSSTEDEFLTFNLKARSVVHVGFDARIGTLPEWTADWNETENTIVDSRGSQFHILSKEFDKGAVTLGGNSGSDDDNMYLVLIRPLEKESEETEAVNLPGYFTLQQNYPNPFNPETTIKFRVHKAGDVKLTIYNVLGQQVRVLVDKKVTAGHQEEAIWDGRDQFGSQVATGVYIYRIQQGHFAKTKRMMLVK